MAGNANLTLVIAAQDMASGVFKSVSDGLHGISNAATAPAKGLLGLADAAGKIGLGVFGITTLAKGVADLAGGLVSGNAEFERYETQFSVLLGSAEAAKKRLGELAEFGAKTPFELPEVVRADKILQAFGLHSEESAKRFGFSGAQIRTIVGDVAAGTGAGFEELATTFGKFTSGATGEAISRFQELGITTRDEMAKMGIVFSKSGEMLSPLPQATEVVLGMMKKKFGGMMDAQSSTFEGMMSNLSDWFGQAKRLMMAPLFEVLKDKLKVLLDFLGTSEVQAAMQNFAKGFATSLEMVLEVVGKLTAPMSSVVGFLRDIVSGERNATGALQDLGSAFVEWVVPAVDGMLSELATLGNRLLMWISGQVPILIDTFYGQWVPAAIGWIESVTREMLPKLGEYIAGLLDWIDAQAPGLVEKFYAEWVPAALVWISKVAKDIAPKLGELTLAIGKWIVETGAPKFAELSFHLGVALIRGIVTGMLSVNDQLGKALSGWVGKQLGIPGFANGGSFTVGGSGGTDSQMVAFRATPGERVSISNGSTQSGGGMLLSGDIVIQVDGQVLARVTRENLLRQKLSLTGLGLA